MLDVIRAVCNSVDRTQYANFLSAYTAKRNPDTSLEYGAKAPAKYKRRPSTDLSKFYRGLLTSAHRLLVNTLHMNYGTLKQKLFKRISAVRKIKQASFERIVQELTDGLVLLRWGIMDTLQTCSLPAMDEASECQPLHHKLLLHILQRLQLDSSVGVTSANSHPKLTFKAWLSATQSVNLNGYLDLVAHPAGHAVEEVFSGVEIKPTDGVATAGSKVAESVRDQPLVENEALNRASNHCFTTVLLDDFFVSSIDLAFSVPKSEHSSEKQVYHLQSVRTTRAEEVILLNMLVLFPLEPQEWLEVWSGDAATSECLKKLTEVVTAAPTADPTGAPTGTPIADPAAGPVAAFNPPGTFEAAAAVECTQQQRTSRKPAKKLTGGTGSSSSCAVGNVASGSASSGGKPNVSCGSMLPEDVPLKSSLSSRVKKGLAEVSANIVANRGVTWSKSTNVRLY